LHGFGAQTVAFEGARRLGAREPDAAAAGRGAVAVRVLEVLNWLRVLWPALLLALLPRCWDFHRAGPSGELVPRPPQLASPQAPVADRAVAAANALALRSSGRVAR
jgi:hypothetical protein